MKLTEDDLSRFCDSFQVDENGCWIWRMSKEGNGYGRFGISNPRKVISAHRASWILFRGPLKPKQFVLHKCDVKACCSPAHLYLGDHAQNMKDRDLRSRHPKQVSEEKVRKIYALYHALGASHTYKSLADNFDVAPLTVQRIVKLERPRYKKIITAHQAAAKGEK